MVLYAMQKHDTIKNGEVELYILTWERLQYINEIYSHKTVHLLKTLVGCGYVFIFIHIHIA